MKSFYQSAKALGTDIQLCLVMDDASRADKLFSDLWREIEIFGQRFSRFNGNSELSIFNNAAGQRIAISPEFKDLLKKTKEFSVSSGGIFNPFVLPALQRSGYKFSLGSTPKDISTDYSNRVGADFDDIVIGKDWAKIPQNTAIDLGGIAKGYLADKLARQVSDKVTGYWLSMGGDIAFGGSDEKGATWKVEIQSLENNKSTIATYTHPNTTPFAVATSGITARQGVSNGKNWHHIIDPRSGDPAKSDIKMATLVCDNATKADVLASCVIISGFENSTKLLKQHSVIASLLQGDDDSTVKLKKLGSGISYNKGAEQERTKVYA